MEVSSTRIEGRTNISVMPKLEAGLQALAIDDSDLPLDHLCEVCQQIPLKEIFNGQNDDWMHIGLVKDILLKKMKMECSMCYLIIKALEQSWTDIPIITQTGGIGSLQRGEVFYISWKPGQPLITPALAESMGAVEHNEIVLRRCEGMGGVSAIGVHVFCLGEEVMRGTSWMGVGGGVIGKKKFQPM